MDRDTLGTKLMVRFPGERKYRESRTILRPNFRILLTRLSQAAACDGVFYQIPAGNSAPNHPPGVLSI